MRACVSPAVSKFPMLKQMKHKLLSASRCLHRSEALGCPGRRAPAFLDVQGLGLDPEHHKTNIFLLLLFLLTVVCNCNFEKWPLTVTVIVPAASDAVILKLTLSV